MDAALILINYDGEQPTVSARDLHEALEIGAKFTMYVSAVFFGSRKGLEHTGADIRPGAEDGRQGNRKAEDK